MRSRSIGLLLLMGLVSPLTACGSDSSTGGGNTETEKAPAVEQKQEEGGEGGEGEETKKEDSGKQEEGGEGGEGGEG
jgi:hypothetical protein